MKLVVSKRYIQNFSQGALMLLFAMTLVAAIHPEARTGIRDSILTDYRVLVSSAKADLSGKGESEYTIAKIKTRNSLFLEIYQNEKDGKTTLVQKIEMPDARDGYFNFNGSATNLALADVDQDGALEILAPSFDRDLVGRLNIFRFNADAGYVEKVVQ
jgi:hypothetical protein